MSPAMNSSPPELLPNHLGGQRHFGTGAGTTLFDPVLGDALVRVDATGLDLAGGFERVRTLGGSALRALSYRERAGLLKAVADAGDKSKRSFGHAGLPRDVMAAQARACPAKIE